MTSSFVILGLLSARPMSGYDLLRSIEESVGQFWSMSRAGIYRELSRLERLGYVTGTEVAQRRRPDKIVYEPTAVGRDALKQWLDVTSVEEEGPKTEFLVKFFFARQMRRAQLEKLLVDLAVTTRRDLDALQALHNRLDAGAVAYERLTARHGILIKQARLAWVAEAQHDLGLSTGDQS